MSFGSTKLWTFHPGKGVFKYQFCPGLSTPLLFWNVKEVYYSAGAFIDLIDFWPPAENRFSKVSLYYQAALRHQQTRGHWLSLTVILPLVLAAAPLMGNCPSAIPATANSKQDGRKKILLPSLPHLLFWQLDAFQILFFGTGNNRGLTID